MALTNFKNGQVLTETEMNKIVTEVNAKATKEELNTKAPKTVASGSADGLMSSADKTKLDGIAASANNYVHPSKHDASVITETEEKRFVSDTEKATWNAKAANTVATGQANGLMSSADKKKLDGIVAGANNYTHPSGAGNNHIPSGGSANKVLKWSADGVAVWGDDKDTTYTNATTSNAGLMSVEDKKKLDGIAASANNYTHPNTAGNKHIPSGGSAGQILRWSEAGTAVWGADNNTTYNVVSKTANGLAPQLPNEEGTTKYLRQDGTWVVPPDTKYVAATEQALGLVKKMPTQADSTAQELAGLVSDFNALLAKLKAAGIMS